MLTANVKTNAIAVQTPEKKKQSIFPNFSAIYPKKEELLLI